MRKNNQKGFGVDIDAGIADKFSDQLETRGQKKFRAIEAALKLWVSLPNELQALLIDESAQDIENIYDSLTSRLREALRSELALEKQSKKTSRVSDRAGRKSVK
jgi:hypothetical protein